MDPRIVNYNNTLRQIWLKGFAEKHEVRHAAYLVLEEYRKIEGVYKELYTHKKIDKKSYKSVMSHLKLTIAYFTKFIKTMDSFNNLFTDDSWLV